MLRHDLNAFFRLSNQLHSQINMRPIVHENIAGIILGDKRLLEGEETVLLKFVQFVIEAYGDGRRRLGTLQALHPLRTAALLARAMEEPGLIDLLTALLHDFDEDMDPKDPKHASTKRNFETLKKDIDPAGGWYLSERIGWLTKLKDATYNTYIGNLLDRVQKTPEIARVKLADRLDNTLDLLSGYHDPMENSDFFEEVFNILFVKSYRGYRSGFPHPAFTPMDGAQRLHVLFKNTVLMSLMRFQLGKLGDKTTSELFSDLVIASRKEAQRVTLHIFEHHYRDVGEQAKLLLSTMAYAQGAGVDGVNEPSDDPLDGLFVSTFNISDRKTRSPKLKTLYKDKALMIRVALAFAVTFTRFQTDTAFYVRGIDRFRIGPPDV